MRVDIPGLCRASRFHHMARRAPTGSSCFWGIIVFRMDADGLRIGKLFVFSMAGETKGIIKIKFDHLELARPSMGIVAAETGDLGLKVVAPPRQSSLNCH